MRVLKHALRVARDEWGWQVPYIEISKLRMPQVLMRHTDRVPSEEIDRVVGAAKAQNNQHISLGISLAACTGMRRGELLALDWKDVDLSSRRLVIRMSKKRPPTGDTFGWRGHFPRRELH